MDPDDCTFWYVGDYLKASATAYSTKIGGFRLPGCLQQRVAGFAFLDLNHDGKHDLGEPGIPGVEVAYAGPQSGKVTTGANGSYDFLLPADPLYTTPTYTLSSRASSRSGWSQTSKPLTLQLAGPGVANFGNVCTMTNRGASDLKFWAGAKGKAVLNAHDPEWRKMVNLTFHLNLPDAPGAAYDQFKKWMGKSTVATQVVTLALNVAYASQDPNATVHDPIVNDWVSIKNLIKRVSALNGPAADAYKGLLEKLNGNAAPVTPSNPTACGSY